MSATVAAALIEARAALSRAGVEEPDVDARALMRHVTGLSALDLVTAGNRPLGEVERRAFREAVSRRADGEPVGRILGRRDFWGLSFALSGGTLEPRPDSEAVIAEALSLMTERKGEALSVLDLGTGTGCLLVALLSEWPRARGLGIDISADAVATATRNARENGVGARATFCEARWFEGLDQRFDLIVSNPPYIPNGDIAGLAREVREHDPLTALAGGADGLDAYRAILAEAGRFLAPGGVLVLEAGAGQARAIRDLAASVGLRTVSERRDLGGHVRAIVLAAAP